MAEAAGSVYIEIVARLEKLEAQMEKASQVVEKKMDDAAKSAGAKFTEGFSSKLKSSWSDEFAGKLGAKMGAMLGPAMASSVANAFADAWRSDKSWQDKFGDVLKSLPYAGAFINAGQAVGESLWNWIYGGASKADIAKIDEGIRMMDMRVKSAAARAADEKKQTGINLELEKQKESLALVNEISRRKEDASDREKIIIDAQGKAMQMFRDKEWEKSKVDDEKQRQLIDLIHAKKITALEDETYAALDAYDKQQAALKDKADKEAKDKADADAKAAASSLQSAEDELAVMKLKADAAKESLGKTEEEQQAIDKTLDKNLRNLALEKALRSAQSEEEANAIREKFRLEQNIADMKVSKAVKQAAAASPDSASTALGAFRFDPYPSSMQREVQTRTMRATEKTAEKVGTGGIL